MKWIWYQNILYNHSSLQIWLAVEWYMLFEVPPGYESLYLIWLISPVLIVKNKKKTFKMWSPIYWASLTTRDKNKTFTRHIAVFVDVSEVQKSDIKAKSILFNSPAN